MTNYKCQNEITRNQTLYAALQMVTTSSLHCNADIIIGPWSSAGSVPAPTGDWANENNTKEAR